MALIGRKNDQIVTVFMPKTENFTQLSLFEKNRAQIEGTFWPFNAIFLIFFTRKLNKQAV